MQTATSASTSSELIERYLIAVKFWLPRDQKDEIIAELSEDLHSQIEEQQSQLGRPLARPEIEEILKRCGAPMSVGQRYLPQRSLIGPALFPIYRLVVRGLLFYYLLPWLGFWAIAALLSTTFRAAHPGLSIFSTLETWWLALTYSLFLCTLAFAILERTQTLDPLLNNWNPRTLPPVRDPNRIPRANTIIELIVSIITLDIWLQLGIFRRAFHFDAPGRGGGPLHAVDFTLSPLWPYFFWALTALSLAGIALACLNLVNPHWTRLSSTLRLGIDVYSWGLAYLVSRSSLLQSLSISGLAPTRAADLVHSVNHRMNASSIWVAVIAAVVLAFDVRRILRLDRVE